jgi:hypothetical protein
MVKFDAQDSDAVASYRLLLDSVTPLLALNPRDSP